MRVRWDRVLPLLAVVAFWALVAGAWLLSRGR